MKFQPHSVLAAAFAAALTGCSTPEGHDGSATDAIAIGVTMLPAAPLALPVLLYHGARVIGRGTREHVYATPGTTEAEFEEAIRKAEGVRMLSLPCEIRHQADDTYRSIYRFEKTVYVGHFTQDEIAVQY